MPEPGGAGVVVAQALDVVDLEARDLHRPQAMADVVELGAGEDVVEEDAVLGEERSDLAEIGIVVGDADVLVHADAGDLVEPARELAVVAQLDRP